MHQSRSSCHIFSAEVQNQIQLMSVEVVASNNVSWVKMHSASFGSLYLKGFGGIVGFMSLQLMVGSHVLCSLSLDRILLLEVLKGNWLLEANLCAKSLAWWISCGNNLGFSMSRLRSGRSKIYLAKILVQISANLSDLKKGAKTISYVGCVDNYLAKGS